MSKEDRLVELLEELVKWTKVTSIPQVKKLLEEILTTPEEKVAYESSDGKSSPEIAKLANISQPTVTIWWKKWLKAGLAESIPARGGQRARRLFSLIDFGIEIPKLIPKEKAKPNTEQAQNQQLQQEEKQEGTS